jgi:hypothetical protein
MNLRDAFVEERRLTASPADVAAAMLRLQAGARKRRVLRFVRPALAAAFVGVLLVMFGSGGGGGPAVDAQAADLFTQAARVAQHGLTPADLKPGQYLYTSATRTDTTTYTNWHFTILVTRTTQTWMRHDYSGRVRSVLDGWAFRTPADRRAWIDAGRPPVPDELKVASRTFSRTEGRSMVAANDYPGDPDRLYTKLHDKAASGPWPVGPEMFVLIKDALRTSALNPSVRAAALAVAARTPCAHVMGRATDALGRHGVVVGCRSTYWGGPLIDEFLFSRTTGALLSERQVRHDSTPAELRWQAISQPRIVGSPSP